MHQRRNGPRLPDSSVNGIEFSEGYVLRNQGFNGQLFACQQIQNRLEIAVFGPAYKRWRIIVALLLIHIVVPAGTVGARYLKPEFFFVKLGPVQAHLNHANEHDTAPFSAHPGSLRHQIVVCCRRRNHHTIGPDSGRERQHERCRVGAGRIQDRDSPLPGQVDFGFVDVHANHAAPV